MSILAGQCTVCLKGDHATTQSVFGWSHNYLKVFQLFKKKILHIKPGIGNNVLVYHFFGFIEIKKFLLIKYDFV